MKKSFKTHLQASIQLLEKKNEFFSAIFLSIKMNFIAFTIIIIVNIMQCGTFVLFFFFLCWCLNCPSIISSKKIERNFMLNFCIRVVIYTMNHMLNQSVIILLLGFFAFAWFLHDLWFIGLKLIFENVTICMCGFCLHKII